MGNKHIATQVLMFYNKRLLKRIKIPHYLVVYCPNGTVPTIYKLSKIKRNEILRQEYCFSREKNKQQSICHYLALVRDTITD